MSTRTNSYELEFLFIWHFISINNESARAFDLWKEKDIDGIHIHIPSSWLTPFFICSFRNPVDRKPRMEEKKK